MLVRVAYRASVWLNTALLHQRPPHLAEAAGVCTVGAAARAVQRPPHQEGTVGAGAAAATVVDLAARSAAYEKIHAAGFRFDLRPLADVRNLAFLLLVCVLVRSLLLPFV